MTLVFNGGVAGDGTHALIIGAGAYAVGNPWGLPSLPSAPVSAQLFADWLMQEFVTDGSPPLASVELLMSPVAGAPAGAPAVDDASMNNIAAAIGAWFARCNSREGNLALFYFCGHGVEKGLRSSLLAADFGASPLDVMNEALDVDAFSLGMDTCLARNQLFILDACRNMPPQLFPLNGFGRSVVAPNLNGALSPLDRNLAVLWGSAAQQQAYGFPNAEPSQFTAALVKGLRGAAWDDHDQPWTEWTLRVERMVPAINDLLKLQQRHYGAPPQRAKSRGDAAGMVLLRTKRMPAVPVVVACEPPVNTPLTALSVSHVQCIPKQRATGATEPWQVSLDANVEPYLVEANYNAAHVQEQVTVRPPCREATVRVP
jgi:Caspase domain